MTSPKVTAARRGWLLAAAEAENPISVRGLFYMAVAEGLVAKSDRAYRAVLADTQILREAGDCPHRWIVDGARSPVGSTAEPFDRPAGEVIQRGRRRRWWPKDAGVSPWSETAIRPSLVVESRSIAGMLEGTAADHRIAVWPLAGQPSLSFTARLAADGPTHIGYLGDLDASGEVIRRTLQRHLQVVHGADDYRLDDLAVTDQQVEELGLPERPGADTSHARSTGRWTAVDAEAIPASGLRRIVEEWIAGLQPRGWARRWQTRRTAARADAETWAAEHGIDLAAAGR